MCNSSIISMLRSDSGSREPNNSVLKRAKSPTSLSRPLSATLLVPLCGLPLPPGISNGRQVGQTLKKKGELDICISVRKSGGGGGRGGGFSSGMIFMHLGTDDGSFTCRHLTLLSLLWQSKMHGKVPVFLGVPTGAPSLFYWHVVTFATTRKISLRRERDFPSHVKQLLPFLRSGPGCPLSRPWLNDSAQLRTEAARRDTAPWGSSF